MFKRVCLIVQEGPFNRYQSRSYFTKSLSEAFNRYGVETTILIRPELAQETDLSHSIQSFSPDLICSFNRLSAIPDKKFLGDALQIPYLSLLTDSPFYSTELVSSSFSIIACADLSDYQMVQSLSFAPLIFFPLAVDKEWFKEEVPSSQPYDIVMLGSCYDYENFRRYWRVRHSWTINHALDDAIDLILSDSNITIAQALVTAWEGAKLTKDSHFYSHFYYLDAYTRGKSRVELIKSIKKSPVHIFGDLMTDHVVNQFGWSHYVGAQPNVIIHPAVSYEESRALLQKSKICLNSTPWSKTGMHERVPSALACGALPFSNRNGYLQDTFGANCESYSLGGLEEVNNRIEALLHQDSMRKEKVMAGREEVRRQHTWDSRVEQLLKELPPILEKMAKKRSFFF